MRGAADQAASHAEPQHEKSTMQKIADKSEYCQFLADSD